MKLGLGNPWAGHNKAKLVPRGRFMVKTSDSVEKAGALEPTGSVYQEETFTNWCTKLNYLII